MKKNSLFLLPALLLASSVAMAVPLAESVAMAEADETGYDVTGYLTGTNNFMYRGVSLSSNSAAIQGQVELKLDSGFYTSLWGSNTVLGASIFEYGGPGLEGNFRAGYRNNITKDLSFDVGYLRTFYPGTSFGGGNLNLDFNDFYGSLNYKGFSAGLSYSDDYFGETGTAVYTYASYKGPIIDKLSLIALVGHTRNSSEDFLGLFGAPASNWTHYIIGLSHPLPKGLEASAEFHGVDSNGKDAFTASGFGTNRFVFNLTRAF